MCIRDRQPADTDDVEAGTDKYPFYVSHIIASLQFIVDPFAEESVGFENQHQNQKQMCIRDSVPTAIWFSISSSMGKS